MLKKSLSSIVIGISIIIASAIIISGYVNSKKINESISVTGLIEKDFNSDLIVWEFSFSQKSNQVKDGYALIKKDFDVVMAFLTERGINSSSIQYSPVNMSRATKTIQQGNNYSEVFDGYLLSQSFRIESKEIPKVEAAIREAGVLLESGIEVLFDQPMYYYTKLADLKIEMVAKASEDGRIRAENIAKNAGSKLGDLKNADMGIFQITAPNSNEDYSWGGAYNTSSKTKRASLTMKMEFNIR